MYDNLCFFDGTNSSFFVLLVLNRNAADLLWESLLSRVSLKLSNFTAGFLVQLTRYSAVSKHL